MERLISFSGLFVALGLAWAMSTHRRRVPWRIVIGGTLMQFVLAWLVLKTEAGRNLFGHIGTFFQALLDFVDHGAKFVFGPRFAEFPIAFKVLPTIVFFSSLMSVLYYLGVMQFIVRSLAWLMQKTLGTSGAETLSAAANIFVGQTEAPLLVKPYIGHMTFSELNAVMVGGFATIAGGVMAAYITMGIDAGHLLTASVISAPAGLAIAKLMVPETESPSTLGTVNLEAPHPGTNVIEAAAIGASDGLKLALNVGAMLIAFLALIAMVDAGVGLVGERFGQKWSLEAGLDYLFAPLAWTMGIESGDCLPAGRLLGLRTVANEFLSYSKLAEWSAADSPVTVSDRTRVILTYALCGFANFGSIGIQLGGLGEMAPKRRSDLARLGLRAMIGGTLACNMTACVAGTIL